MNIIIIIIVLILAALMIGQAAIRIKRGSLCCGEHEQTAKRISVKDKDRSHYPYVYELEIEGMVCSNCVRNVENALNSMDGIWASADLAAKRARVLSKKKHDKQDFVRALGNTSYTLLDINEEDKEDELK